MLVLGRYFRSGLDRYIWIFGMLCGFVHPYLDGLMTQVDAMSKAARYSLRAIVVAACAAAGMAWYHHVYVLPKLEYNAIHPYTSWIPISIWAFMRNLTPRMRVVSLGVFGWLGCITLETYMGQFHTWLSSSIPDGQPVGLLEIIPDYPLINFGVVTAVSAAPPVHISPRAPPSIPTHSDLNHPQRNPITQCGFCTCTPMTLEVIHRAFTSPLPFSPTCSSPARMSSRATNFSSSLTRDAFSPTPTHVCRGAT